MVQVVFGGKGFARSHLDQELLVFRLQGQREAVDNGAEDLQQLTHSIEVLSFVDKPEKRANEM